MNFNRIWMCCGVALLVFASCNSEPVSLGSASSGSGEGGAGQGGMGAGGAASTSVASSTSSSSSGSTSSSSGSSSASSSNGSSSSSASSSSSSSSSSSGGAQPPPTCLKACQAIADCTQGSPAFDADNYDCNAGACVYSGCNSDAECSASLGAGYVCSQTPGSLAPLCQKACQASADCTQGSPAFDADNYSCNAGACIYNGCNSNAECAASLGAAYVCALTPSWPKPLCQKACQVSADCSQGSLAFDADNYDCVGGACSYSGCNTTAECVASLGAGYVCH